MADSGSSGDDRAGNRKSKKRKTPREVRNAIEDLYFEESAGTVLPEITEFMRKVQASLPTVEKALDQLLIEGVVTYRVTKGLILTGFGREMSIERSELGHVLEVRLGIEPVAAQSAARAVQSGSAPP